MREKKNLLVLELGGLLPKLYGVGARLGRWVLGVGASGHWAAWARKRQARGARRRARGARRRESVRTRWARQAGERGALHGRCARGHARPGRAAKPTGCALDALSLF